MSSSNSGGLNKTLGLTSLIFYGVGSIIGAGIYSIIGAAANVAHENLWQSFLLASVVALLTGLCYAELASLFPKAGAEYIYIKKVFPKQKWLAFITGFILALAAATTATTVSTSFAGYFNLFFEAPTWIIVISLLVLCTILNVVGIRESSWVNITFTVIEVVGLAIIIYFGSQDVNLDKVIALAPHSGVLAGTSIIFFIFLGFNDLANLSEESKNPEKHIPIAIIVSLIITTILYVAVAITVMGLTSASELAKSDSPLSFALQQKSAFWAKALGIIALFSTANTALINMIVSSRLIFSMARDGDLPKKLSVVSKRKTPWVSALLILAVAAIFVPFGDVAALGGLSSFASLLAFAIVNLCLFTYKRKHSTKKSGFSVPFTIKKFAVIPFLGIVTVLALATQFEIKIYLTASAALVVAFSLFYFTQKTKA